MGAEDDCKAARWQSPSAEDDSRVVALDSAMESRENRMVREAVWFDTEPQEDGVEVYQW